MKFWIVTLFPGMFEGVLGQSMMWKAQEKGLVEFEVVDLREFGIGPRKQVDDSPYGGGDGMVLKPEPLFGAIGYAKARIAASNPAVRSHGSSSTASLRSSDFSGTAHLSVSDKDVDCRVVLMTPRGERWVQATAKSWAEGDCRNYILVCGHYEGFDERVMELVDLEVSVGDYVLTGGELPAMTVIDSVVRLIPGVLGGENSAADESFSDGETLEYPHYTRPEEFRGMRVPEVLLSGHHAEIEKWRRENSGRR